MERQPSSSSDEEDDGAALIDAKTPPLHRPATVFEVGAPLSGRIRRRFGFGIKCLLAACVPLLLALLIYFSADLRHLLKGASAARLGSALEDGQMREAELRALFLLRNQRLGLLRLWNRTSAAAYPRSGGSATAPLSNSTSNSSQVGKPVDRRTIEWNPKKDKFLFAICLSGQMSNHLICLQKHMFFAALLGRMLVMPSPKFDYQYDLVIDIEHINKCFGRKVVISFEEFSEMKKNKMQIDRFICYMASPPCFVDEEHAKRLKALGLTLAKLEPAWPEDAKLTLHKKRMVDDVTNKFSCADEVLAVGDLFYANVEEEWVMQPGGPLAHKCETVIQPSRLIVLTAQRFAQTFLGSNYVALHFRRHGFLKFCNAKDESCFFPVPQAAECILRVVEKANAPVIYLSTDAAESETNLLQSLVVLNDKAIPLVKRPDHTSAEKWDALLYRNHLGGDNQSMLVNTENTLAIIFGSLCMNTGDNFSYSPPPPKVDAMLDKTICAMASVFIGSSGSTFTDDIFRLRKDWGSASICDENLCHGEQPNYIAEKE
ncbi:hypothetical protein Taro_048734 [Colocasia esculenta]|uniref:O-fucosyltransferase family protein n=1 Tax=Colocasia esculenta TaxID=4460 RepID=A0A843X8Y8_COLES|nr:hypothetical protein [Colocasia esculenta]